jgi:radical SAM superfamily enzyme YgiQ (UPF0313 family)
MQVALIQCPAWDIEFPPYNIALLSAALKQKGFSATCFDLNRDLYRTLPNDAAAWLLSDPYAFWQSGDCVRQLLARNKEVMTQQIARFASYDALGFTLQSLNYIFTMEFIKQVREKFPAKIILAGGPECFLNFNSEFLVKSGMFDALCFGEGEEALPELLSKIQDDKPWNTQGFFVKNGSRYVDCGAWMSLVDLNKIPHADYSFLDPKTEKVAVSTSRGCINNCAFCLEKTHSGKFRYRAADSIVDEIVSHKKNFPSLDFVYLNDSLINGNMHEFERFCDLMIESRVGVQWGGHILARKEMTKEILCKMKKAGADRLNFGVESGSDVVLKAMRKSFSADLALQVLTEAREAGLSFSVNLIVGHPGETDEEFEKTVLFFKKIRQLTGCVHINPCLVLKGSDLYLHSDRWGIILPENFVTEWFLADGTNNLKIRTERAAALGQALETHS